MICPDCEMETDKLVSTTGTCMFCYKRQQNKKYKGEEYIPLKDIKGTIEYNRVMGRRNSTKAKHKPTTAKKPGRPKKATALNEYNTNNYISLITKISLEVEDEVKKDIENFFNKKGIKDTQHIPLEIIFEWFYTLCQENNYIEDLKLEKQCYDTLIINYMHELKADIQDETTYTKVGKKIAMIQNRRTPIDNELDKFNKIKSVFDYLKNNQEFMSLLQDARVELLKLIEKQKDPKYISDTPSMQKYDFVIQPVNKEEPVVRKINNPTIKNEYTIKILKVRNLYGNPSYQPFNYTSTITASSIEEARASFLAFMKRDFPNVTFNTKDVIISLVSKEEA